MASSNATLLFWFNTISFIKLQVSASPFKTCSGAIGGPTSQTRTGRSIDSWSRMQRKRNKGEWCDSRREFWRHSTLITQFSSRVFRCVQLSFFRWRRRVLSYKPIQIGTTKKARRTMASLALSLSLRALRRWQTSNTKSKWLIYKILVGSAAT